MNEEIGISIQSSCHTCNQIGERCPLCQDELDANDTYRAWQIVDEGNLQYQYTLSQTELADADWVSSETVVGTAKRIANIIETRQGKDYEPGFTLHVEWTEPDTPHEIRHEFADPSHKLQDGMSEELALHLSLAELDDETQRAREVKCPWCHLMTPKQFNDCQDCERPLESNVR